MKKNFATIVVCSLFLVVCLSACNQTQFPTGSFTHRSYGDFTRDYVLELNNDGTWTYLINQEIASFGTYSTQDNEFIFETDDYCDADQTGPAPTPGPLKMMFYILKSKVLTIVMTGEF